MESELKNGMFTYDNQKLGLILEAVIRDNVNAETWEWLKEKSKFLQSGKNSAQLNTAFAAMPRKTGKKIVIFSMEQEGSIEQLRQGFTIRDWSIDRLCRVWLLMQVLPLDKDNYARTIEILFSNAEMNELVALYSSLPVLAFPESWKMRCAEGIRSNIGLVLKSIMCDNPYPSENLDEPAWNQLVLKAFFTEKPVHTIIGLDDRANKDLAKILSDYAHERWAAHRTVNPQLWRCVSKFINDEIFPDLKRIAFSENSIEREAAVLACLESSYPPAQELIQTTSHLRSLTEGKKITWEKLAEKASIVS